MPYQAVFGEELLSCLQDEESGGHRVMGTEISVLVLPETAALPELKTAPTIQRAVSALIWRMKDPLCQLLLLNVDSGNIRSLTCKLHCRFFGPPRVPASAANSLIPSLMLLVGLLLVVAAVPSSDVAVTTAAGTASVVHRANVLFSPQLKVPSRIRWLADC